MKSMLVIDTPETCGDCPLCIFSAEEKRYIGYCNTSDEDYYCKALERFMEYDTVEGGVDILGKPNDCPLMTESEGMTSQNNPAESSQDCISRDAVRKLIWQNNDKYGYSDRFHEFTERCLQLPSVTPQPKTGKWIPRNAYLLQYKCSECGWKAEKSNYCPNCGADMRGDTDEIN